MRRILFALLAVWLPACDHPPAPPVPGGLLISPGPGLRALASLGERVTAPRCGAPLRLAAALPDPTHAPDDVAEWVELANDDAAPVSLDGWVLASGRRRRALDGLVLAAGERRVLDATTLRPVRLRNRRGAVALVDPCDLRVDELVWGRPGCRPLAAGQQVVHPAPWGGPRHEGPARPASRGARGGCGQT